ncbi:MAG TPA: two-component regulator propeller domain-containing protein [Puia sp.]|jgi:signal transduction histidine kinase|nr:two-component regulator propeller domain-containing protein [Puia sp.]
MLAPLCRGQEYLFVRYTHKDGLVNSRTRFLYQDSKGRLYVSTYGGLSVYDGSRFTSYTTENGLSTSMVNDVIELGDDSLLIVPNGRGLHVMVHGIIRNIPTTDHYYPVTNQLVKCSDGCFYAISDDGLFRWEGGRFVKIALKTAGGMEAGPYLIYAVESGGKLFLLTDPHLQSYPGSASLIIYDLRTHRVLTSAKPDNFTAIVRSPTGEVDVSTPEGIRVIDQAALRKDRVKLLPLPSPYGAAGGLWCNYMLYDHAGNLWLSTGKKILKADRNGVLTVIGSASDLPVGIINSIFEDREGNIWLTNSQNGIARLQSQQVQFYAQVQPDFTAYDLTARPGSDSVWLYDWDRGNLLLLTPGGRQVYHGVAPLPVRGLFGHILFSQSGWLVSQNAIYQLHFLPGNRFQATVVYQDTANIDGRICFDRKDNLVLPTGRLTVYSAGRVGQLPFEVLADQAAIDKFNRIWVAPRSSKLLLITEHWEGGKLTLKTDTSWPVPSGVSPRSIAIDNAGRIWLGTRDHGLYCLLFDGLQLRSVRQLTIKNGLSENFIRYLYCDEDNTIWAGTPSGLDKIRYENDSFMVTNIAAGHEMTVEKINQSAGGIHWVLAGGGYLKIFPSRPPNDGYRPKLLFSQVLVGNDIVPYVPEHPLSLRYDQNALSFYVGVPTYKDESQTRFSYLLEGSSEARWSAPSNQSAINFVNLPPGEYVLHVKAQFLSGIYPDEEGTYAFRIRPPWWQAVAFRAAMAVLLAAGIGWAIRSYTLRRLKAQRVVLERQKAIEKERTRIATDMHDDLGAGLSRIKFLSDTIGIKQQRRQPIDEEISGIRDYSKEMIDKMGEIVWALNQKNDMLSDLLSYTRSYAAAYLMQAGIRSRIEAPEEFPYRSVSGEFRRNVYLAVKEALHNIVKHSQAQEVHIRMEVRKDLVIVLQDDGIGFDRATIRPYANGLANMERRIADLGGRLMVVGGRRGTTVSIEVPMEGG